jgi:hypothetical protein
MLTSAPVALRTRRRPHLGKISNYFRSLRFRPQFLLVISARGARTAAFAANSMNFAVMEARHEESPFFRGKTGERCRSGVVRASPGWPSCRTAVLADYWQSACNRREGCASASTGPAGDLRQRMAAPTGRRPIDARRRAQPQLRPAKPHLRPASSPITLAPVSASQTVASDAGSSGTLASDYTRFA